MKNIITLAFILLTLGTIPTDNNLYIADLPCVTVIGDMLKGYVPKRTKTEKEFIEHNEPLFQYIAKHTWLSESQAFSFLRMEQGNSSDLFIKHNNPFNVKSYGPEKKVSLNTWEHSQSNRVMANFRSYETLREGLTHFIELMNTKYHTEPLSNIDHAKWLYDEGYFTDPQWIIRVYLANKYQKLNV
jgi:hypothetical protein